jgi:hypothetical protein
MSNEAMKLALEAYCKTLHPLWNAGISRTEAEGFFNAGFKAAEALAKQEQGEPVAWVDERSIAWLANHPRGKITTSLEWQKSFERPMPLYTTPQQRKPLTHNQRVAVAAAWRDGNGTASEIIDMVEAAHGIKGEA